MRYGFTRPYDYGMVVLDHLTLDFGMVLPDHMIMTGLVLSNHMTVVWL